MPFPLVTRDQILSEAAGGVRRYRDGAWTLHEENLPGGEITAGCEGPQKELWFGATSGLNRLRKIK